MKKRIFLKLLFIFSFSFAQNKPNPIETVERFFSAFHAKDSLEMQAVFHPKTRLLRSAIKDNQPVVIENNVEKFIRAVAARKDSPSWEERLGQAVIQQDQNLATLWVPFRFYLDDTLSHCGVNAFTMVWNGMSWQILSLIDTGTNDCPNDEF